MNAIFGSGMQERGIQVRANMPQPIKKAANTNGFY